MLFVTVWRAYGIEPSNQLPLVVQCHVMGAHCRDLYHCLRRLYPFVGVINKENLEHISMEVKTVSAACDGIVVPARRCYEAFPSMGNRVPWPEANARPLTTARFGATQPEYYQDISIVLGV